MAENTLESTSEVQNESVLASLGLDTNLFVSQLINFVLVFLIVWFLLLKPLAKKLEERREMIDESIDKAKVQLTEHIDHAELKKVYKRFQLIIFFFIQA